MALESKPVFKGKATLGTSTILGVVSWSHSGQGRASLDDTEMGDKTNRYLPDILEGGKITLSGNFKNDDTTGHSAMLSAMFNESGIGNLRLYVDNTSYYTPNDTTAANWILPAGMPVSQVLVESYDVDFSGPKGALGKFNSSLQVDGVLTFK
jgi:hypothetical protein